MKQTEQSIAGQEPIPIEWRSIFIQIVDAFASGNYNLEHGVEGVVPVSASSASQIRDYVADYGAKLVSLPEETWETSVCTWSGDHWDVLVDLWTKEEGPSDMVLHSHVRPLGEAVIVEVHAVYVP